MNHHDRGVRRDPGRMPSRNARPSGARSPVEISRRQLIAGGSVLSLTGLLSACSFGGESATGQPIDGGGGMPSDDGSESSASAAGLGTVTIGVPTLQEEFVDPHFAVGGLLFPMRWAIAEGLYRQDLDCRWIPNIAEGYEISDDELTWTFTLYEGITMHDGSPLTAHDQKTAIDRVLGSDEFAHLAVFRDQVKGAKVVDDLTIQIMTHKPYATLLSDASNIPPIPTGYYDEVGDKKFREAPMSCGAFKFVEQQLNSSITYERFDDFFDEARKPNFKTLVYEIIPDESSRVAGMKTGSLDVSFGFTPAAAEQLKGDDNLRVLESQDTGQGWLFVLDEYFPEDESPLHDVRVRKALLMAIDRESIVETLYRGYAKVPKSSMTPLTLGYEETLDIPYDPDGAKALLEEAGATDLSFTLNSYSETSTVPDVRKLVEAIASYWDEIGVSAKLNIVDPNSILASWRTHKLRGVGMLAGPSMFYDEPSRFGSSFFHSKGSYTTLNDPAMDELLGKIDLAVDDDKREALSGEFREILDKELYGLPVILMSSLVAIGPSIADFKLMNANPYAGPLWELVVR